MKGIIYFFGFVGSVTLGLAFTDQNAWTKGPCIGVAAWSIYYGIITAIYDSVPAERSVKP